MENPGLAMIGILVIFVLFFWLVDIMMGEGGDW